MVIEIQCKSYVAAYLKKHHYSICENGVEAVDLSSNRFLKEYFLNVLSRASQRFDNRITLSTYPDKVFIHITNDEFDRYGYTVSKTSMLRFNTFVEDFIKKHSRIYVGLLHRNRGIMKAKAIRRFQEEFGLTEDVFPYETIKKDIDRHVDFEDLFSSHKKQQLSLF